MVKWEKLRPSIRRMGDTLYYSNKNYSLSIDVKHSMYLGDEVLKHIKLLKNKNLEEILKTTKLENNENGEDLWVYKYAYRNYKGKLYDTHIEEFGIREDFYSEDKLNKYFLKYKTEDVIVDKTENNVLKLKWKYGELDQVMVVIDAFLSESISNVKDFVHFNLEEAIGDEVELIEILKKKTTLSIFLSDRDYKAIRLLRVLVVQ